jgi:hypothetical protein
LPIWHKEGYRHSNNTNIRKIQNSEELLNKDINVIMGEAKYKGGIKEMTNYRSMFNIAMADQ